MQLEHLLTHQYQRHLESLDWEDSAGTAHCPTTARQFELRGSKEYPILRISRSVNAPSRVQ